MTEAKFVVFEGIDGSGTSTQSKALTQNLIASGSDAIHTWEPTDRPVGKVLRDLLSGRLESSGDHAKDRKLFALLFAADRQDHLFNVDEGIHKHLADGNHVVCARYVLSSLAYEGEGSDELAFVHQLNDEFPVPDLTVYLDCPVEVALGRIQSTRDQIDVFENEAKLTRVRNNYLKLIESYPGKVLKLDATLPPDELSKAVIEQLLP